MTTPRTSTSTSTSTTAAAIAIAHPRGNRVARAAHIGLRMLAAVAILGGTVAVSGLSDGTAAVAAEASCANGVTVVVDFTDIGGKLDVACAEGDQATGRAALLAAGFTATDSQPGFLCAINSKPDPCPTTFAGSFWSYWHSTSAGEWTSYQVGADSSTPAKGEVEGWRYNDGTTPPGIAPAEAAASATSEPTATPSTDSGAPTSDESVTTAKTPGEVVREAQNDAITYTTIGFFVVIAAVVTVFVMRSRRRKPGAAGADSGADAPDTESHD